MNQSNFCSIVSRYYSIDVTWHDSFESATDFVINGNEYEAHFGLAVFEPSSNFFWVPESGFPVEKIKALAIDAIGSQLGVEQSTPSFKGVFDNEEEGDRDA